MRACIKALMSLNIGQIRQLTTELAALEHLENQCLHFSRFYRKIGAEGSVLQELCQFVILTKMFTLVLIVHIL